MACREDTGRDVRVFPTEVRPEQDPRKTVRPENTTVTHEISRQRAGGQRGRYVVFVLVTVQTVVLCSGQQGARCPAGSGPLVWGDTQRWAVCW